MATTQRKRARPAASQDKADVKSTAPEIGRRIYAIRKARHLTLCDVEKKSGLAISVLSQIERGRVNPTFNTLWQLTQSLNIDISDLIERSTESTSRSEIIEVVSLSATPTASSGDERCTIRVHTPQRQVLPVEWFEMTLAPGVELQSQARADRAWQHVTVVQGTVEIELAGKTRTIKAGDTARFSTKFGHSLRCRKDKKCILSMVVISSFDLIGTGYSHYQFE